MQHSQPLHGNSSLLIQAASLANTVNWLTAYCNLHPWKMIRSLKETREIPISLTQQLFHSGIIKNFRLTTHRPVHIRPSPEIVLRLNFFSFKWTCFRFFSLCLSVTGLFVCARLFFSVFPSSSSSIFFLFLSNLKPASTRKCPPPTVKCMGKRFVDAWTSCSSTHIVYFWVIWCVRCAVCSVNNVVMHMHRCDDVD